MLTAGVRYMFISTFFFAVMNLLVKMIPNIPAIEIVFFRSLVSLVLSFVILKGARVNIWGNNKLVLLLRGGTGAVALIMYFLTLQVIPLASAVTIQVVARNTSTTTTTRSLNSYRWINSGLRQTSIFFIGC